MRITVEGLRDALGAHFGSVLTPELAASILCASVDREDRAIDPGRFAQRVHGDLTFAAESFRDILPDLRPLHEAHFAETERHLAGFTLQPDYDYMAERERMGTLVQFTARNPSGDLVGNLRMYLGTSLHTGNRFAEEDTFYLHPAARRGAAAIAFLRYAEEELARVAGVVELRANTKLVNQTDKLMAFRKFHPVATQFIKFLNKE